MNSNILDCAAAGEASTSGRRVVISRHEIPIDLLVARHEHKVPKGAVCSAKELRQVKKDAAWAMSREHMLAAGAAAFHLALFAWNLAFWGFEGMPPDRWVTQTAALLVWGAAPVALSNSDSAWLLPQQCSSCSSNY